MHAHSPLPVALPPPSRVGGVRLHGAGVRELRASHWQLSEQFRELGMSTLIDIELQDTEAAPTLQLSLPTVLAEHWTPGHDTSRLCTTLGLDTRHPDDLCREIILSLLAGPQTLAFPSLGEWMSALRVRINLVRAARDTVVGHAPGAARPSSQDWIHLDQGNSALRPGRPLIAALQAATQPAPEAPPNALSGLRASEHVLLLGMAEEARRQHPALYLRQVRQAERRLLHGDEFRRTWLRRLGQAERPLPARWAVPGDRLWFRNPHAASAAVPGHDGLWSIYLGNGLYSDFRRRGQPQSLTERCIEIHHWRHGLWWDAAGQAQVHEGEVTRRSRHTWDDPRCAQQVLTAMLSLQSADDDAGGCVDPGREFPRWLCPGTCDIPDL